MPKRSALTGHATLALLLAFQVLVSGLHAAPEVRGSTGRVPRDRGVHPKDFSKYKKGDTFACIGDEGTVVPASSINDDFCDCTKDGSDEPGTSACSYLKSSRFYCKANPSKNFYIYTSRVDDGICDCCDGEDETSVDCPNTCKELAKKILEVKRKKASQYIKGLELREQYVEKAVERMQGLVEERESLNRQTVSVDLHLPKLQEVADAYERVESTYKRQMEYRAEMNYIHRAKLRKLDANTLRTILLPNLCIQGGKAGIEALMEQYKVDIAFEERENTTIHQLFKQYVDEPAENSEVKEDLGFHLIDLVIATESKGKEQEGKVAVGSLLHRIMEIGRKTSNFEYLALISLEEYENIQAKLNAQTRGQKTLFHAVSGWFAGKGDDKEYDGSIESYAKKLGETLDNPSGGFAHSLASSSRSYATYARDIKQTILSDYSNLLKMEKTDFGEGNAFLSMYDECFSKKADKYKYSVCPFKSADQDGTSLGRFEKLVHGGSGKARMSFKNGQRCPGGQERELSVVFYCGKENEVTTITEPSPCSYAAKFVTPAVCGEAERHFVSNVKQMLDEAGLGSDLGID